MKYPFPYSERAAAVRAAEQALIGASRGLPRKKRDDKTLAAVEEARKNHRAAIASAYPPNFWSEVEKLKSNDLADIDVVIAFLEGDPMFSGSGYLKIRFIRFLRHVELSNDQMRRLQEVILNFIRRRNTYEFRELCRLAYGISKSNNGLYDELKRLASSSKSLEARRANWMLIAIDARRFRRLRQFAVKQKS